MELRKELKEFAKWLDGSAIKKPIEKMADHYWQEFKAQGISSNAVLADSVCPSCKGELIKFTTYGYDECLSCGKTYRQTDR